MNTRRPIAWRRVGQTALRSSLRGAAWLLPHSGRLLQSGGQLLHAIDRALNPAPPDPRRE